VQQLQVIQRAIAESRTPLPQAELLTGAASNWLEWFKRLAISAGQGPVIVVLDEFPWMTETSPTLEGELQIAWDRTLEKLPVLLILIGSDVAMMKRLGEHDRPLFGRLRELVVGPLNPAEIAEPLGSSAFETFNAYLITGGYPRLVADLATAGLKPETYVRKQLQDPYSPLVSTARFTLEAEFPDPTAASQVLSAIGSSDRANPGYTDVLSTISDASERKAAETALTRSLNLLQHTKHLVELEIPAWSAPKSKLRRYRVADPYLRFWFRYIERQVDNISRGRPDLAVATFDRDWSAWRGRSIEPVIREALLRLAATDDRLAGVEAVAPWWNRANSIEVDVVATTRETSSVIGTIKWRPNASVSAREMAQLRTAAESVPRSDSALFAAVSPSGDRPDGADLAFSAADLLSAWQG
jgi:AAA+ ATPase superfamily predicted ATPase